MKIAMIGTGNAGLESGVCLSDFGHDVVCVDKMPGRPDTAVEGGDLSPAAPFRVVNIGNSDKVHQMDFVDAIESELGREAIRNYIPMQTGDVPATWADASLLESLTGYTSKTELKDGVAQFVKWYLAYQAESKNEDPNEKR